MPSLYVIRGRDQGKFFSVEGQTTHIGRDTSCAIQLLDNEASRTHAQIRTLANAASATHEQLFELIDLESSNGTLVNGQPITRYTLRSGDRIQIGQTLMIFTGSGSPDSIQAAHSVDIISQTQATEASRIVSSWAPSVLSGRATKVKPEVATENLDRRSLDVMYQTAIAVGRTMDIPELLERILRLVFDWVEADRGCVMLRDSDSDELRPAARCDRSHQPADRMAISRTILDFVIERREGVRTTDAREDARWDPAHSIVQMGIREALCVPLLGRYECVGALYVDTFTSAGQAAAGQTVGGQPVVGQPQSRFNDEHLRLMTAIGHQAALAIEDTFYYSSLLQNERLAAIGQTIAIISHHMKNILQGMRGGGYLIGAGLERQDQDAIRRGWRIVEKNQERISHLVLDMLSYSKDREPERELADLNATVADVVELMQVRAEEQQCVLEFFPAEDLPACQFDNEAMHRAILNLVTNALDAVAEIEQARVWLRSGYHGEQGWWLEVADNGPGISPEDRDKVFSLFESRKGNRGTGLGLPVSQKIVAEHGGTIELLEPDQSPRQSGCTFRVTLPAGDQDAELLANHETLS
ncbi:ATP-binding protein [Planctomycetaceae bacterium SH139]